MVSSSLSPQPSKVIKNFEILVVKTFSLKQKLNQILPATIEKIKFCLITKTASCSSRIQNNFQFHVNIEISNHAFKYTRDYNGERRIHTHSAMFRYFQTYSGIIRHIRELFKHIQNPVQSQHIQNPYIFRIRDIFRTLRHNNLRHINNPSILRALVYSKLETYSEPESIQYPLKHIQ